MNPWDLSASDLLIWGIVLHLIADWPLQTDWMAKNKANLKSPAGYVHAFVHGAFLSLIFGWVALPLAILHLLIDTRWPVVMWSKLMGQTQPKKPVWIRNKYGPQGIDWDFQAALPKPGPELSYSGEGPPLMDVGMEVRFWVDQVFHIVCIAVAALLVTV